MVGRGLFLGVFFIAYAIQAITGFAGNIIAMPAGMATVGMQESVAMLNATGMIGCGLIAIQNWKHAASTGAPHSGNATAYIASDSPKGQARPRRSTRPAETNRLVSFARILAACGC